MRPPEQSAPSGAPLRRVRALALAATVVVLGAGAHVLAGGSPPPVLLALGALGLLYVAAHSLARRRLTPPVVVVFLAVGQAVLHTTFMTGSALMTAPASGGGHAAMATMALSTSITPTMVGGHLIATAVSGMALARGEAALWVIRSFVGRRLLVVVPRYLGLPSAAPVLVPVRVRSTGRPLRHDVDRRGPPCRVQV